jgi:hypothetical protein
MSGADVQDAKNVKQRQFSQSESCRCLCIGAYKFFARFLMSSAIEGLASNLVSAAAASASTALFSGIRDPWNRHQPVTVHFSHPYLLLPKPV